MDAIIKHAGYHEHFFRAGGVSVESCELGTGVELENLRLGAIRTLPEDVLTYPRKNFLRGDI